MYALIAIGLVAAALSFHHRYEAEAKNRRVEIVVDWSDAQALANIYNKKLAMDDVLTQLRQSGVTTIAVTEDTLGSLYGNGVLTYRVEGKSTAMTFSPGYENQLPRVYAALQHKTQLGLTIRPPSTLVVAAPWSQFNGTPIGLADDTVHAVRRNKLLVAPRLYNYTGVNTESINWELGQVRTQCGANGLGPLIFAGSAVLGYRAFLHDTANALEQLQMTYGTVEFAKTFGDADLSRFAADRTVRVHSIGNDEMGTMDEPTAQERFVRAAKERNIRVLYVRLFTNGLTTEKDVIVANTTFVRHIVRGLVEGKLKINEEMPAHPWQQNPTPSRFLRVLMALGIMAGLILLVTTFTGIDGRPLLILSAALLFGGLVLAFPSTSMKAREILALLAACTFPTLALCGLRTPIRSSADASDLPHLIQRSLYYYVRATLVTIASIVFVVGLLSGRLFLLKVDEFLGVKAVLVVPVFLVFVYYSFGMMDFPETFGWPKRRGHIRNTVREFLAQPILVKQVLFWSIALVALALFVARSGNDPGVGVSPLELKVRALLDHYLLVRPRTKEFLLGHPALFLAFAAIVAKRNRRLILALITLGAIGQASLVDTFCHLHTPLFLSMLRATIGWVLGAAIGILILALVRRYFFSVVASETGPQSMDAVR